MPDAAVLRFGKETRSKPTGCAQPETGRSRYWGGQNKEKSMRSILLWLIGIPIPVIILLYLFGVL